MSEHENKRDRARRALEAARKKELAAAETARAAEAAARSHESDATKALQQCQMHGEFHQAIISARDRREARSQATASSARSPRSARVPLQT